MSKMNGVIISKQSAANLIMTSVSFYDFLTNSSVDEVIEWLNVYADSKHKYSNVCKQIYMQKTMNESEENVYN